MRNDLESSEALPAECERGERGMALHMQIAARIIQRAGAGDGKRELASGVDIAAAEKAKAGDVDVFGARVDLETTGLERSDLKSKSPDAEMLPPAVLSVTEVSLSTWPASAP